MKWNRDKVIRSKKMLKKTQFGWEPIQWADDLICFWDIMISEINWSIFSFSIAGCRIKVHKDHLEKKEEVIAPCKVNYDPNSARELLLLANSVEEQQVWVSRLRKKIEKCGYAAQQEARGGSSPRYIHCYIEGMIS